MKRVLSSACAAALGLCLAGPGAAAQSETRLEPSSDIARLLDVEPLPPVVLDPTGRYALLVQERQLLSLEQLSEPAVELAGHAISLVTGAAHAPLDYYGLTLVDLRTLEQTPVAVPYDAVVGYPRWSADGLRFAFTVTRSEGAELWVGDSTTAQARAIVRSVDTTRGPPCSWLPDNHRLLCRVASEPDGGRQALVSIVKRVAGQALRGEPTSLTEQQAAELLETQLEIIDCLATGRHLIGRPTAFESVMAAPAQAFLLVRRLVQPYPQGNDFDAAAHVMEIWDRFGNVVARLPDAARAIEWQATSAATLVWVERRDGADRVMSLAAPFGDPARERFALPHRFAGVRWLGDSSVALVSDYDSRTGRTDLWSVDLASSSTPTKSLTGYDGAAGQLPIVRANQWGFDTVLLHDNGFYLRGTEVTDKQRRSFLDHVALRTGARERIWTAPAERYESLENIVLPDASLLLVRRESQTTPNYFLTSAKNDATLPLTHFERPSQLLVKAQRIPLEYRRADGVDLRASLYLPPNYDRHSPLPLILWAYPRQVSVKESAVSAEAEEYSMTFARAFRLFFLLRGYAVLDDVSMPIVGSETDANDTFVEQVIANASAAIEAAGSTHFVDTKRVGVAGHSYGAFMVANLLVHSRLFAAGVALSGAYNRTLTPFGFQTERRTLWQAQKTYLAMSPLLFSDRIEAPLLLVHGLKDTNAGTSPQQSLQFYQAIRGNGGEAELLLLPWEGHSYRGRESVLRTAAHMLSWFDQHLKPHG